MIDLVPADGLTSSQSAAVAHCGGNLLVEAGPGSGKTRVIVARCASLLAHGTPAARILILTFSRRAAGELRTRLASAVARADVPDIRTFHGFAARLLAEAGPGGRSRRLLSEPAERALFAHAAGTTTLATVGPAARDAAFFRTAAAVRVDEMRRAPAAARARLAAVATPRIADLFALDRAQTQLRERLSVADYDDLVAQCVIQAESRTSAVARALAGRYDHVLVDEFQDTDPLQLRLLAHLGGELFAVGDAAQAIYGFRGAARDALEHARTALGMSTVGLNESFRCPQAICDLARSVWPAPPNLISYAGTAAEIAFVRAVSPQDEAILVAGAVRAQIASGTPEREIAVLVRGAEPQARLIERELRRHGIAATRQGGDAVIDDRAVDALSAALRAFARPDLPELWADVLGHPAFGAAPLPLRSALDTCPPRTADAACALVETLAGGRVPGARLAEALRAALACWRAGDPGAAARTFAAGADVLGFVVSADDGDARRSGRRIEAFLDALGDVRDMCLRLGADGSSEAVWAAFCDGSADWRMDAETIDDEAGVRILTVHAAKGLEFAFVAIADAAEGRFPLRARADPLLDAQEIATARACGVDLGTLPDEHVAEERSLWYVAVTRSKRKLLVTWSDVDPEGAPQRPSRFIPLESRTAQAAMPPFRGPFQYAGASPRPPQMPSPVTLSRTLSTSAMESWLLCRRRFYYAAVLHIGGDERPFRAKLGSLVHRAIQAFHAGVADFRSVVPGAHAGWSAALRRAARAVLAADDTTLAFDSPQETRAALRAVDRLVDRYARELERAARAEGFIVDAERAVRYETGGVTFVGRIDRVDRYADGTVALVDIKTAAYNEKRTMAVAYPKLAAAAESDTLWRKGHDHANPQLALYRFAEARTRRLAYLYLGVPSKFDALADAARIDELDVAAGQSALAGLDGALNTTLFAPLTAKTLTAFEPTRVARTCRSCEFVTICPGYLEDEE